MTMIPGTYTLSQNVTNPTPDRRKRSDWRAREVWQKGATFLIREEPVLMPPGMPDRTVVKLTTRSSMYSLGETSAQVQAILPHLVLCENETPSEWLNRMDYGINISADLLDHLVASGKLTQADIKVAYIHCLDAMKREDDKT